jgi:hypothetical protein
MPYSVDLLRWLTPAHAARRWWTRPMPPQRGWRPERRWSTAGTKHLSGGSTRVGLPWAGPSAPPSRRATADRLPPAPTLARCARDSPVSAVSTGLAAAWRGRWSCGGNVCAGGGRRRRALRASTRPTTWRATKYVPKSCSKPCILAKFVWGTGNLWCNVWNDVVGLTSQAFLEKRTPEFKGC